MGKANRDRRRAKLKDRERQRERSDHRTERSGAGTQSAGRASGGAGWQNAGENSRRPPVAEAVMLLVTAAINAQVEGDRDTLAWCAAPARIGVGSVRAG